MSTVHQYLGSKVEQSDLFLIIYRGNLVAKVDAAGEIYFLDKERLKEGLAILLKDNPSPVARVVWGYIQGRLA